VSRDVEIEEFYRRERARILATVIRLVGGDFHLAEEAVQEAFAAAWKQWPEEGWPTNPRAWVIGSARHKAIDTLRRAGRLREITAELAHEVPTATPDHADAMDDDAIPDDRLRLIFTCCHPALALEAQVALALRTLCGLTTDEIARAFLVAPATMAQRLVRAQRKIAAARIPYVVPPPSQLPERLEAVLAVIYLVFNEGYAASGGAALVRGDLCNEAIRLARLTCELLALAWGETPALDESRGLLALMLLHDARRAARTDANGEIVLLEDQDRSRWNHSQIAEGLALILPFEKGGPGGISKPVAADERAASERSGIKSPLTPLFQRGGTRTGEAGPYILQAALAAEHVRAASAAQTDWRRIVALYDLLLVVRPSPVVALNRAVAVGMAQGPEAGLAALAELKASGGLDAYHLLWAAEADLLRRLDRRAEAAVAYRRALELVGTEPERRFLERRLTEMTGN
jgi:RNA polymerase sigma-70 factor (ECF subfamily)